MSRYSDPLDEAAALSASLTDAAIDAARRNNGPEKHPDFDGESCVDCGEDIPKPRLALGKVRCVECQGVLEHRAKQQGSQGVWNQPWPDTE